MVTLGADQYTYEVIENFAKLPPGYSFKEVGGVGCDTKDNVYVFSRGAHPMMVFDKSGNFLRSWGEGLFPRAHGVTMAPGDTMFLTDDGFASRAHASQDAFRQRRFRRLQYPQRGTGQIRPSGCGFGGTYGARSGKLLQVPAPTA